MNTLISCSLLPPFDPADWFSAEGAFTLAAPLGLEQAWQNAPDERFAPGWVRVGWNEAGVWIYATLQDANIWNPASPDSQAACLDGDVFEIFARPLPGERYFELHVTPHNHTEQLVFESPHTNFRCENGFPVQGQSLENGLAFCATTLDGPPEKPFRWRVLAQLNCPLMRGRAPELGDEWLFSASRYDYTRGFEQPVLSSTSPHCEINFHRQNEWARLCLAF